MINYRVREYIPAPIRCYKCQRIGHIAQQCHGKQRCAKCGGEHEYGKCEKGAKMRCCNCGGEHSAAFGGCAVQIKAKEVQKYKIINNVSYAEALKKVNDETQRTVTYEDMGRGEEDSERPRPLPREQVGQEYSKKIEEIRLYSRNHVLINVIKKRIHW